MAARLITRRNGTRQEKKNMALDAVSHFFDKYRQKGHKGEETLQLLRENMSKSIRRSSLGDCKLHFDSVHL